MAVRVTVVGDGQTPSLRERLDDTRFRVRTVESPDDVEISEGECVLVTDAVADPASVVEELCARLDGIPVVLVTETPDERLVTRAFRAGAADHIALDGPDDPGTRIEAVLEAHSTEREAILSSLYDAVQRLLLARTPEEIASITVETASEVLDLPITAVYRHEEGTGLVSVAHTERVEELFGEVTFEAGRSLAWDSFEAGKTRVINDVPTEPGVQNSETVIRTELHVPFGEEWLLVSGSLDRREFDQYQIEFAQLLATTAETAIQRAEREAALSQYEIVFRTIDERVCVVDFDGRFRMVNDALCSFLEAENGELLGEPAALFVDRDDIETVQSAIDGLGFAESTTVECRIGPSPDRRVPCEIDVTTLPRESGMRGIVVVIHDISDRKRVESALDQQRDRFAELFEHVPDPVVETELLDDEPVVRSVNAAFEDTFDAEASTVVGDPLNDHVLPPDGDSQASELDRRTAAGELIETEVKRETGDGIRYFLFRGVPVDFGDEDEPMAFGIYTDITDQRLRERRLGVLNRVFRHNIRNDMNVVLGRAEYIETAEDPGEIATHAGIIRRNAERIVELADGIHAAEQTLSLDDAPHRPIDQVVVTATAPFRDRSAVTVTVDSPERPLPAIDERLRVAIEELVENAIEHTGPGPVDITVAVELEDESAIISVSDDGPGIPDAERGAIQSGRETSLDHGSGVGLWLVSWITTALGGELAIDSGETGTTVRLTFPKTALDSGPGRRPDGDGGE